MAERARGFSLLELAVAVCVLSILFATFLNRLTFYQQAAERAQFESTLQGYKTALQIRVAELILERREAEASTLEVENPTRWLSIKPTNYAGEYAASPQRGNWYFDASTRELVYVVNSGRVVAASGNALKQLRFRVKVIYQPVQVSGARVQSIGGVAFLPAEPYEWS